MPKIPYYYWELTTYSNGQRTWFLISSMTGVTRAHVRAEGEHFLWFTSPGRGVAPTATEAMTAATMSILERQIYG